jgi:hypothetical protein
LAEALPRNRHKPVRHHTGNDSDLAETLPRNRHESVRHHTGNDSDVAEALPRHRHKPVRHHASNDSDLVEAVPRNRHKSVVFGQFDIMRATTLIIIWPRRYRAIVTNRFDTIRVTILIWPRRCCPSELRSVQLLQTAPCCCKWTQIRTLRVRAPLRRSYLVVPPGCPGPLCQFRSVKLRGLGYVIGCALSGSLAVNLKLTLAVSLSLGWPTLRQSASGPTQRPRNLNIINGRSDFHDSWEPNLNHAIILRSSRLENGYYFAITLPKSVLLWPSSIYYSKLS